MTCPDCGHDNLSGVDLCEHCGQDLSSVDVPVPRSGLQRRIMETPLRELSPARALVVSPADPVSGVIGKMQAGRLGSALVVERGRLVGIFTERDALNRLAGQKINLDAIPVGGVMTPDPRALRDEDTLALALHCMAVGDSRHVPVVQEGQPFRFVSVRAVLRHLHEHAG